MAIILSEWLLKFAPGESVLWRTVPVIRIPQT